MEFARFVLRMLKLFVVTADVGSAPLLIPVTAVTACIFKDEVFTSVTLEYIGSDVT